jgi:hypothetical protein
VVGLLSRLLQNAENANGGQAAGLLVYIVCRRTTCKQPLGTASRSPLRPPRGARLVYIIAGCGGDGLEKDSLSDKSHLSDHRQGHFSAVWKVL